MSVHPQMKQLSIDITVPVPVGGVDLEPNTTLHLIDPT
jgi:hypothetical protein